MHMLLARSAFVRGMQLVAGMLSNHTQDTHTPAVNDTLAEFKLVSWTSNARSRREDELARSQMQIEP
ncbi:hypothetical protein GCM10010981_38010 [Dyella nitratireducens]|uniref:Secreted protein n=1 Tax=Dyella nitratireducens TaxID=1849580 RepID=A0ABQ1GL08_9GAMM|nr:hypothetical protein GCM10010981_38010 [Dyella nitratireducens]GLQ41303.1 hypothetical protein GCM10007902_11530 [Dyella nitratireducens]